VHTAEPTAPVSSASEVEFAIGKLSSYEYPGFDQIPAELVQAGGETLLSEIHKLSKFMRNKEDLPNKRKESFV
jgi:hypothetical protein